MRTDLPVRTGPVPNFSIPLFKDDAVSTFSGLNTAYTGLVAARQGLNVVGQNIANANTTGYTRQRLTTSSIGPAASTGMFSGGVRPGQGVSVDAIARLGNDHLDARVRSSAAVSGYATVRANVMGSLETTLKEPSDNGIAARLADFWAGWQDVANSPNESAPKEVLLSRAGNLAAQIGQGYQGVNSQWSQVRTETVGMVDELNGAAAQVADLNKAIRSTLAGGGSANELIDARSTLTTQIAALAGGTVRDNTDGTVDVVLGGNAIVSGITARTVELAGSTTMAGAADAVRLVRSGSGPGTVNLDGGEIAGAVSMLAPAAGAATTGTGGPIAEQGAFYNTFAAKLAEKVNFIYQGGTTVDGKPVPGTGPAFFSLTAGAAGSMDLAVTATAADLTAGAPGAGALDGSVADKLSQLGVADDSPDRGWAGHVAATGLGAKTELQQATMSDLAATSAVTLQLSNSSVDMDEENVNLLMYQHAYQGAARVMTAVDEMLDTLINRTGLVGR